MLSEWSFQMLIGAPIARLPIVITMGNPRPAALDGFRHEQEPLAARRRVGARPRPRPRSRPTLRQIRFDIDEFAIGEVTCLDHLAEALDDVRLRRDRIGADHLRPAQRTASARHAAFRLFKH
jgi:hypothetical protein